MNAIQVINRKDAAIRIRAEIKSANLPGGVKVSVKSDKSTGSVYVTLAAAPFAIRRESFQLAKDRFTVEASDVIEIIKSCIKKHHDDRTSRADGSTDILYQNFGCFFLESCGTLIS